MAFVLEGETTFNIQDGGGNTDVTLPGTPVADDFVIYAMASDQTITDGTDACVQTTGYTLIMGDTAQANPGHESSYKKMGATPDTIVTFNQASGTEYDAGVLQVWSGQDTTTPEDTTPTTTTGSPGLPNSPSITTVTNNALVFSIGFLDDDNAVASPVGPIAAPSGYSNLLVHDNASNADNATAMISSKVVTTAGAEDPAVYTTTGSATDAWAAATFALRPSAGVAANPKGAFGMPFTRPFRGPFA